jgi:hypothetical protein
MSDSLFLKERFALSLFFKERMSEKRAAALFKRANERKKSGRSFLKSE